MNRTITNLLDGSAVTAMYGGAGASIAAWGLAISDLAAIVSAGVAVLGFVAHLLLSIRKDAREAREHAARMEEIRGRTADLGEGAEANAEADGEAQGRPG